MADFEVETLTTKPISGQKPGTSGLRKKVSVFREGYYLHNFVQSIYNALPANEVKGSTIVVGGDGRFWNKDALQIIIKISAANGVSKLIIGKDGIFSTPAVSAIIRARKVYGGIILTASHNPGGEHYDFGIKYNTSNGGPAPEGVTDAIWRETEKITQIKSAKLPEVDLSKIGTTKFGSFEVEIADSVQEYLDLVKSIFDFPLLKKFLARKDFKFIYDSMNGVTGPYTTKIFVEELGAPQDSVFRNVPLPDFGGSHPDPNLTYAEELVEKVLKNGQYDLGAASDGDGDRNMILGKNFFVTPSDSVAVIAANCEAIPYYKGKLKGVSRSMPTGAALDHVAKKLNLEFFEVPTGWKFFGNLMDAGRIQICGEESFGTGSDHIREKDGIWAVLCWLSILASRNQEGKPLVSVGDIVREHWKTYGRNFFTRYDYEECESDKAANMIKHLNDYIKDPATKGKKFGAYTIQEIDDFEYKDPIDNSVSKNQGIRIIFTDGSRLIYRLSGTGSSGATIRVYLDKYDATVANLEKDTQEHLKDLIQVALEISQLQKFTGREKPTVIT
jgi:phosphoglucomutase